MLIVPEIQTVVILTPRTGSRSLKNAVMERYPQSFLLYRHMEADGIPAGYDQWAKVGVVRDPVERLFSLYKFLGQIGDAWAPEYEAYVKKMRASVVGVSFSEWVLNNEVVFTDPYSSDNSGKFWPQYNVRHRLPENRKSQWITLRPDLGTEVYGHTVCDLLWDRLGLEDRKAWPRLNSTQHVSTETGYHQLTSEAEGYMKSVFAWDFANSYPSTWQGPR